MLVVGVSSDRPDPVLLHNNIMRDNTWWNYIGGLSLLELPSPYYIRILTLSNVVIHHTPRYTKICRIIFSYCPSTYP